MPRAQKVFVPAHAPIGRGFPGFARETTAVNQYDGTFCLPGGHLITHIHLIDGDGAARCVLRQHGQRVRLHIAPADEEAALLRNGQRPGH